MVSKHDSRDLIAEVERSSGTHLEVPRSAQVEILEPDDDSRFVIIDGRFTFVNGGEGGGYLPYVGSAEAVALLPSLTIDEGAVKYIIKGADVMRPGISAYDEWGDAGKL
ncbi:MAG TPA: PUA domain-containing protein, partial [Nitrososphaerales archaeon]|nr:PUA domain-containing protein [Nitrososphaerales archaeon]